MPAGAHRLGRDGGREVAAAAARLVQGVPSRHRHRVGDQPPERRPVERDFDAWLACSGETSASRPLTRREDTLVEETLYEEARLPVPAHLSLRRRGPHPRRAVPAPSARRHRRWTGGARGVRRVLRHGTVAAPRGPDQGLAPRRPLAPVPAAGRCAFGRARVRERATSRARDFESARRRLALPTLGSFLWSRESTPDLNDAKLASHDFLEALRHLAFTRQNKEQRQIIVCTHDPNILVGGDAEQVVVLEAESDRRGRVVSHGSIDNDDIVGTVVDLLEGGAEAFRRRRKRYGRRRS